MTIKRTAKLRKRAHRKTKATRRESSTSPTLLNERTPEQNASYIEKADHRYELVTSILEDFTGPMGIKHKAGAVVEISAKAKLTTGEEFFFPMPSMVGLYLSMSNAAYEEAETLRAKLRFSRSKLAPASIHIKDSVPLLFDVFERRIASVVFAYTAIEAFINESIPVDFQYERIGKKSTELMKKEQIERWVPIEEKLKKVLPLIKAVPSPASSPVWATFHELKKERDRLIHLKHRDMYEGMHEKGSEAIWGTLAGDNNPNYAKELRSFFEHYCPTPESQKRWMHKAPYWA